MNSPCYPRRPTGLLSAMLALLLLSTLSLIGGCDGPADTGPIEVKWDRDVCQRCRMVLSDRRHAAEIRYTPPGKTRSQIKLFDDIGCAMLWLDEQDLPAERKAAAEVWVNDWRNGDWIDARSAHYLKDQITPMEYGLGAQPEPAPGAMGFDQARAWVQQIEQRFNVHGAHLKQQASQRKDTP